MTGGIIVVVTLIYMLILCIVALFRIDAITWWILDNTHEWRYFPRSHWQRAFQSVWRAIIYDNRD